MTSHRTAERRLSRRRYLAATGSLGVAGLAGCLGDEEISADVDFADYDEQLAPGDGEEYVQLWNPVVMSSAPYSSRHGHRHRH